MLRIAEILTVRMTNHLAKPSRAVNNNKTKMKSALAAVLLVAGSCGLSGGVERVVQAPSTNRLAAASAARKVRDIIRSFQGEASAA